MDKSHTESVAGIDNKGLDMTMDNMKATANNFQRQESNTSELGCTEKQNAAELGGQPINKGIVRQHLGQFQEVCAKAVSKKHNRLPEDASHADKFKYTLLCPPKGDFALYLSLAAITLMLWGFGAAVTQDFYPGGHLFALLVLVVAAYAGGYVAELVKLPGLMGMLIVGILLRNVPYVSVANDLSPEWSSKLRNIALVVILTRAGLGLDPQALRRLSMAVIRLAFSPCLLEAITVAVASHFLLGFPWLWGFMMGFIQAAVSPAVVVPCLLSMQERGYGVDKGIPTLVIAAASLDDVLAISAFGITLGLTFSEGDLGEQAAHGPLEVVMGLAYGFFMGVLAWYLPNRKYNQVNLLRVLFLFLGGLLAVLGSGAVGYAGAGALGTLVFAFVAAHGWRKQGMLKDGNLIATTFATMWKVFQPILFGLIGTEIMVSVLEPSTVGFGLVTLFIGLAVRVVVSFFAVFGAGLTLKERLFVALAWLPKATVQAAIGPVALDYARSKGIAEAEHYGVQVLTIAVLVILVTAPIGAAAIMLSGPKLLKLTPPNSSQEAEEDDDKV